MSIASLLGPDPDDEATNTRNSAAHESLLGPKRFEDLPERPLPKPLEDEYTSREAWYVTPDPDNKPTLSTKKVVKRVVSVIFPILGLLALIGIIGSIVMTVAGFYE